jgi:hypothetical protein
MIKLRVEWHHTCPDCGTRVVVDYMADAHGFRLCPWCGRMETNGQAPGDPRFRKTIADHITKIENRANSTIAPKH